MATVSKWTPFGVALDLTATGGTVTRTSATQFTVVINASWKTTWDTDTDYGMTVTSGGKTVTLNADGHKSQGSSGTLTGTYSISGNGSATKTITVTFKNFNEYHDDSASKSISLSVSVPAWTSYKITYNANGGSGAPGAQTKWKDQTLTLSSTKPTRTGYSFLGWSTSSDATTATYSAGGSYTANSKATLYAVWKANTYKVTYNANGGTGAPSAQTKTYGKTLALSSTEPTRENYTFKGWATSASATTAAYAAGGSYTSNEAITLYAVWELAYVKPTISNVKIVRNDDGNRIDVSFDWKTTYDVNLIDIGYIHSSGGVGGDLGIRSGTSGSATDYATNLDPEKQYTVRITVEDSGGSWTVSQSVPGMVFAMDVKAEAKGIAFGKAAELDGYADFGYNTRHRADTEYDNDKSICGYNSSGVKKKVFCPQNTIGDTVIGYDNYVNAEGDTMVYGNNVYMAVRKAGTGILYRPYRTKGDSLNITVKTAGYVTNSGKDVSFTIPLSIPVLAYPTVTVASGNGFTLRQGEKYTHGSSATTYTTPATYTATCSMTGGVTVVASFNDVTNVTNNDAIGIYWNGTITFS